ncbi:MAG: hypothetical protein R3181_12430 [Rubricoccaceae bacterium]|nr:hypothetical protein [Rubricoccaceae bacterium]
MDFVTILIYLAEAIIVLSLLMMVGFGLRALIAGRKNYIAIGSILLALVVFAIAYVTANPDAYPPTGTQVVTQGEVAIVMTAVVMMGLALLALVVSAVRGVVQ